MWLDCEESANSELEVAACRPESVPVVFARDLAEAEHYRALLEAVSIPAVIESPGDGGQFRLQLRGAVPVRVPDHLHEAATEVVAAAQSAPDGDFDDDFEDDDLDDDEEDDFDDPDDDDDLDDDFDDLG